MFLLGAIISIVPLAGVQKSLTVQRITVYLAWTQANCLSVVMERADKILMSGRQTGIMWQLNPEI